jgi:hypothetical protein
MSLKSPHPEIDRADIDFFEEYGVLAAISFAIGAVSVWFSVSN